MTREKINEVTQQYAKTLAYLGVKPFRHPQGDFVTSRYDALRHAAWMLSQIPTMEDLEKCQRWLAFVQGVLWGLGFANIESMREHNAS